MPVPNKLYAIAVERGVTREELVISELEREGSALGVAQALGLGSHFTILNILKKMGYVYRGNEWVSPDEVSGKQKRDGVEKVGSHNTAARPDKRANSLNEGELSHVHNQS